MTRARAGTGPRNGARPHPTPAAGRVAPHNLEAEESLLGAMLLSTDAIADAVQVVSADDFYRPAHGHVFDAICALFARGESVDPVTVGDQLSRAGLADQINGLGGLLSLQVNTPASSNAARYARIVYDHALLRRMIGVAGEIAALGYEGGDDVPQLVDRAERMLFELGDRRAADSLHAAERWSFEALDHIAEARSRGAELLGLPTGFHDLDRIMGGLKPSQLIIVGARPSVGKTSFALSVASHVALQTQAPVLLFSLEMVVDEVSARLLCMQGSVDTAKAPAGHIVDGDWKKLSDAAGQFAGSELYIDDFPEPTMMDLRARSRRLMSKLDGGLGLVVIDYAQLIVPRHNAENRQVAVAEISRSLKGLARELKVPVVALCQLNREVESRADKRPLLADLRESGAWEQDADVVALLHRPELYSDSAPKGLAEVNVAKHRNGPTGPAYLAFLPHYARFSNMAKM